MAWEVYCLCLAASVIAVCSAAVAADPAVDSKPFLHNSIEPIEKSNNRESHALKSDVSYANYLKSVLSPTPASLPASSAPVNSEQPDSIPFPHYSSPSDTTMG